MKKNFAIHDAARRQRAGHPPARLGPGSSFDAATRIAASAATIAAGATFYWTIDSPNVTIWSPGNQTNNAGDSVNVTVSGYSSDNDALTYSATGLPSYLTIDPASGAITGNVPTSISSPAAYTVTITGSDESSSVSATTTFYWTIDPPNVTIWSPGNQSNNAGDSINVTVTGYSSDNDALTYTATGLPSYLTIDPSSGEISGTVPLAAASADYTITIIGTDESSAVATATTFYWTIDPPNVTMYFPGDQANYPGDSVYVSVYGSSSDGYALSYYATGLPAGLGIDNSTGEITGTVAAADATNIYAVTITGADSSSGVAASTSFYWTVDAATVSLAAPANQTNFDGDSPTLQISATDAAGNSLAYTATGLPPGLNLDYYGGDITGTISPDADAGSPYSVTVTATDSVNGASASQTFNWAVSPVTVTLYGPGDQTNCDGDSVTLGLTAVESASHALTFAASDLPDGLSIDPNTGEISGTIADDAGVNITYSVTVTATDEIAGVSSSQTFNWTLLPILVINPGDQYNYDGDSVNLTLQAEISYAATDRLTFSETGLPPGLGLDDDTGEISGTVASNADTDSPYSVTVTVTDAFAGLSNTQNFAWFISPISVTVTNPGDQDGYLGSPVSLSIAAFDSAYNALTYNAVGLPPGLSMDSGSGVISGTIDATANTDTPYSVTVAARDTAANVEGQQTFAWTVSIPTLTAGDMVNRTNYVGDQIDLVWDVDDSAGNALTFNAANLPAGLSMDATTGEINGTASTVGDYNVTLTAIDSVGSVSATASFSWTVSVPTSVPIPEGSDYLVGDSGELCVSASEGVLANAINPTGEALTAELVSGVPACAGTLDFNSDGSFSFTAAPNWNGMTSFEFDLDQNPGTDAQVFIAAQGRIQQDVGLYYVGFQSNANIQNDGKFTSNTPTPTGPDFVNNTSPTTFGSSLNYLQWLDINVNGTIGGAYIPTGNGGQDLYLDEHQYPASFTMNTKITLMVGFEILNPGDVNFFQNAQVLVSATGPNNLTLGAGLRSVNLGVFQQANGNAPTVYILGTGPVAGRGDPIPAFSGVDGWVQMDNSLPNQTAYYSSFQLNWRINVAGTWITPNVSTSTNQVFVTLAAPTGNRGTTAGLPNILQTVLYVGGNNGATTQAQLVTNVFAYFQNRQVTSATGTPLQYYGNWLTAIPIVSTQGLIQNSDGSCFAWANLLIDALDAEGGNYSPAANGLTIWTKATNQVFLVKNWSFNANQPAPTVPLPAGFTNYNLYAPGQAGLVVQQNQLIWGQNPGVTDLQGVAGQNQPNPLSLFQCHCVVQIGNIWYDPSYGLTYNNTLSSFQTAAVAGYGQFDNTNNRIALVAAGPPNTASNWLVVANGVQAPRP